MAKRGSRKRQRKDARSVDTATGRNVLTIDPGIATLGWAVMPDRDHVTEYGLILTEAHHTVTRRLKFIYRTLYKLIRRYDIGFLVVEDFFGSPGMRNRSAVISLCKAHGAIQVLPRPVWLVQPREVMKAQRERNRDAKKMRTVQIVRNLYGLNLKRSEHHVADAILQGRYYFETQAQTQ